MSTKLFLSSAIAAIAASPTLAGVGPFALPGGVITIQCARPGMRRCGIAHPAVETYPLDRWTEAELEILDADPNFIVSYEPEASVAPGATTADAVQDQGAGPAVPDLGAKSDGSGPAAPILATGEAVKPPVFDDARVASIRSAIVGLAPGEGFTQEGRPRVEALEKALGFRPSREEIDAAIAAELGAPPATN